MPGPIVTVTLNPAIDQTLVVEHLEVGEQNRVTESRTDPGGKGINVSRALRELGTDSIASGFAPGGVGRFIEHELRRAGIETDFVRTSGETRTNITIVDARRHVSTTIHNAGPDTAVRYVTQLREKLRGYYAPDGWLVLGGSLPPPLEPDVYADLLREAQEAGVHTALDTEGDALRSGLSAQPELVRVSPGALEELLDEELDGADAYLKTARQLHADGVRMVLVTPREGRTVAVCAEGAWLAVPPTVPTATVISEVGWTDATLAGAVHVLYAGGTFEAALRRGVAAGRATMVTPGTMLGEIETVDAFEEQVRLEPVKG